MRHDQGASATQTGPSQAESFDPARITEALKPLDANVLEPLMRRTADDFYSYMVDAIRDYLLDNLDFNLKSHVEMLERENQRMRTELFAVDSIINGRWMTPEGREETLLRMKEATSERTVLLYAVGRKHPLETRFQTALRYITEREAASGAETRQGGDSKAAPSRSDDGPARNEDAPNV